jgi:hypothetical protein
LTEALLQSTRSIACICKGSFLAIVQKPQTTTNKKN